MLLPIKAGMLAIIAFGLVRADSTPPTENSSTLVIILAAAFTGGLAYILRDAYRRWKDGDKEDALQIAKAAREQATSSNEQWSRYKVELEAAQKEIARYLEQLVQVSQALGAATEKVSRLQVDLDKARSENASVLTELAVAQAAKANLEKEVDTLRVKVAALEAEIRPR